MNAPHYILARVLDLVEHSGLSATDLRVLLELVDHRDASISELERMLADHHSDVRRAVRDVSVHGLVRAYHGRGTDETLLELNPSGRAVMEKLLAAANPPDGLSRDEPLSGLAR